MADDQQAPLIDPEALGRWLDEQGIGEGELTAERIGEGHSNVTFLIERGGRRVVLRRPPRPPLPPSAHDVLREARVLRALEPTEVRVPTVIATCDDESVLGVPFYLMEEVKGTVITDKMPEALDTPDYRGGVCQELVESLVEIHAADWEALGLEGFGKPSGYLERQLKRFSGLWEHNKTREVERVQQVEQWLRDHMPEQQPTTIVHGDYRLGNVMVADEAPPRVVAVFDWELSTLGDPLADVGYMTVTWVERGDPTGTMWSQPDAVTRAEGWHTRDQLVALYEELSGRSVSDLRWYQALALWKASVFMEGNYKRFQAGNSDDQYLAAFDEGVPALADAAWEAANTPAPTS